VSQPRHIELLDGTRIPILYEDRSALAIDKPAGWMLAPDSWARTGRNLQLALASSLRSGAFWARSRHLSYLRFVHRLDAETSGVLLLARQAGALRAYSRLFATRQVDKHYLAVVRGLPRAAAWTCQLPIGPQPGAPGRMRVDPRHGKAAETRFDLLQAGDGRALVRARPSTGRTHQIRVHLAATGHPVIGDPLYNSPAAPSPPDGEALALRAVLLAYPDPFQRRRVRICAPSAEFCGRYGFAPGAGVAPGARRAGGRPSD
jgi:RluA family pseudouridine synthase